MIKIITVKILNFRSYKDKENILKSISSINVIVGKNNVGKTNILRALYLFFNPNLYNYVYDRNMIKQITGGATKEPKIILEIEDNELIPGVISKYSIVCDLNSKDGFYSVQPRNSQIKKLLDNNSKIDLYLKKKFKCVYLSTTDENIASQSETLVNEMILQYYKKQSKEVKQVIEEFEVQYKQLIQTFEGNISAIEKSLAEQFNVLSEIDLDIKPKLEIVSKKNITDFLLDNIELKLDDSYAQDLSNKGAGIQRASLILLSLFLLNEIFSTQNKIILLDEPEAFLYPLLIRKIKDLLEEKSQSDSKFQIFLTSHSRDFLKEINNTNYNFSNVQQKSLTQSYTRSKNDFDINKYSVINQFELKTKYEVLKNYGLLDDIDDYENVIICEGPTDKNYLERILKDENIYPQIRFNRYSDGIGKGDGIELNFNYIGKGANSVMPLLIFLENISDIHRKVFVLLDGDDEGQRVFKQIHGNEFHNLEIHKFCVPNEQNIEDILFKKEDFNRIVLSSFDVIKREESKFIDAMNCVKQDESLLNQTMKFLELNRITDVKIPLLKHKLSTNLEGITLNDEWLRKELRDFFVKK